MPKTVTLTIPDKDPVPEIISSFSPEENILMLKIGSDCLREGRNVVAGLTQKEIYNKIKEESKEEVKKLEMDLTVQREMSKQMEEKIGKIYDGQVEQLKKQIESMREQIQIYESGNKENMQKEIEKVREKYELLLNEKDKQNQMNREVFDKAEKLVNKTVSKSSIEIGDDGENIFESLSETFKDFSGYRLENKAKQGHKGDFHLFFDDFNILVDSKNYSDNVQRKEIVKIENDLIANENMKFAWMVSLKTNICNYNRFPISYQWVNTESGKKCILFINNLLEHNPKDKLRLAWSICNEINKLTKNVDKEDDELTKYREKDLIIQKQIKGLQERTSEMKRNMNSSLNILKNMDNDLIQILSMLTNEIIKNTFEKNSFVDEWWNKSIEFKNDESKLTSTEIWNKFKRENKDYVADNKLTIDWFKDAITSIVDGSTYTEKTKKGAIEFNGFKFRENMEGQNVVIKDATLDKKSSGAIKKVNTEKLIKFYFDEKQDNEVLSEYGDISKDIMKISFDKNIRPWQVVSVLMRHNKIIKREDARGYEIYKETDEYKQKINN
jgi:hypothetical protein